MKGLIAKLVMPMLAYGCPIQSVGHRVRLCMTLKFSGEIFSFKKQKISFTFLSIVYFTLFGCNNFNLDSKNNVIGKKNDINICDCLMQSSNSGYNIKNTSLCNELISKEVGVLDWRKVNFKLDKVALRKFDLLVYKCTGKLPSPEISGTYSGTDNLGMESTIILGAGGRLVINTSIGDGTPDLGWWTGTADDLYLYHKDFVGNDELIGKAKVTEDGLKIIGGNFYKRK